MPTRVETLTALGRQVVADGRLWQLQARLQFSQAMMAELLLVSRAACKAWARKPAITLKPEIALRVGRFYDETVRLLAEIRQDGIDLDSLVPAHLAALQLGWPLEHLNTQVRTGTVDGFDLDALGLWIPAVELQRLKEERRSVAAKR